MQKVTEEEQLSRASSGKAGFVDCFKGSNRRRTLIACFIVVVQQAAGVVFYSNSSYFLL
jgi:SP family general alpha glucoside:H+ symporter-like MFS transporter